ncbi:hypothetical protein DFJ77DRAFT_543556 [Powellomyces hirtus]|nr:hypothetical protein DFJ77DRAFT_543556 [Powellomyces hirtus]
MGQKHHRNGRHRNNGGPPPAPPPRWLDAFLTNSPSVPYKPPPSTTPTTSTPDGAEQHKHNNVPYQVTIHQIDGVPAFAGGSGQRVQLRASFYDGETAAFFGRTWVGAGVSIGKRKGGKGRERSVGKDEDEDSERSSESEQSRAGSRSLESRNTSVTLNEQTTFFHTLIRSPHILIVIEIVYLDGHDGGVSGGWTFFRPFTRNFVHAGRDEDEDDQYDDNVVVPLYVGTPRVLPLLSTRHSPGSSAQPDLPSLTTIPGASITYSFRSRRDIRAACALWKPNVMVGRADYVPGLRIGKRGKVRARGIEAVVSEIQVRFPLAVEEYAQALLASVHMAHKQHHPPPKRQNSLTRSLSRSRPPAPLAPPQILERRLHIGLHNSHTFLHDPVIINLDASDEDDAVCCVRGALQLERFVVDPWVAVVVAVEYRVRIPCLCAEEEGGWFFGRKGVAEPGEGVERGFMVGWGAWVPEHEAEQQASLELTSAVGDNPFMTPMYRAKFDVPLEVEFIFDGQGTESRAPSPVPTPPEPNPSPEMVDANTSPMSDSEPDPPKPVPRPLSPDPPPHKPYIRPITPPPRPDPTPAAPISRIHLARLHEAGFPPPPLNDDGTPCAAVEGGFVNSGQKRDRDSSAAGAPTPGAELDVCFMGVSFAEELISHTPIRIYLSYSMHAQPYTISDTLFVHTGPIPVPINGGTPHRGAHGRSASAPVRGPAAVAPQTGDVAWPGIFWTLENDRRPAYARSPGCTHTYRTSSTALRPYLQSTPVTIDVFDGDTHQFLGTCCAPLTALATSGRVAEGSVEIVRGGYGTAESLVVGRLFLRVAHVRRKEIPASGKRRGAKAVPGVVWPKKMIEVDAELRALLQSANPDSDSINNDASPTETSTRRKAQQARRIAAAAAEADWPSSTNTYPFPTYTQTRAQQLANLHTIHTVRTRLLRPTIHNHLTLSISTHYPILATFGQAHIAPFFIQNPYTSPATFCVTWHDADLRAITPGGPEAAYLARCNKQHNAYWNKGDAGAVVESNPGRLKVFLNPGEEFCVPFLVQSFLPGGDDGTPGNVERDIDVEFTCAKTQTVLSILTLEINPTPFVTTRHDRLYVAEKEVVRHVIRGSVGGVGPDAGSAIHDMAHPGKLYVRCHDTDVVCEIADDANTNTQTLTFKHTTHAAPSTYTLYFLLYNDPYHTSLREIWRCIVHSLHRVHVAGVLGQPTQASVVVRGGACSRAVSCCVDRADVVTVMRLSPLVLTANALNEIPLLVRPKTVGSQQAILNIVDVDTMRLHSSYLLHLHTSAPPITKSFTLTLPRFTCQNKRISYTNEYAHTKTFHLHTPTPHLLSFVHDTLELGPGETVYIGLRLLEWHGPDRVVDVMVMLNDEEDRVVECLGLRIMYE